MTSLKYPWNWASFQPSLMFFTKGEWPERGEGNVRVTRRDGRFEITFFSALWPNRLRRFDLTDGTFMEKLQEAEELARIAGFIPEPGHQGVELQRGMLFNWPPPASGMVEESEDDGTIG